MQTDLASIGYAAALDNQFKKLAEEARACVIYARIGELENDVVDQLAWDMHVDFYDSSLPLDKKRELVKRSIDIHLTKGTPYAIEQLLEAAFSESWVKEWFQYGGDPYTFKVKTTDRITSMQSIADLKKAIDTVKNTRSHLTNFEVLRRNKSEMKIATVIRRRKTIRI